MSLRITLWGQRAKDFSIGGVGNEEDSKPIGVLFVGCLAKYFQGLLNHGSKYLRLNMYENCSGNIDMC
jgi:hypothetical protein